MALWIFNKIGKNHKKCRFFQISPKLSIFLNITNNKKNQTEWDTFAYQKWWKSMNKYRSNKQSKFWKKYAKKIEKYTKRSVF